MHTNHQLHACKNVAEKILVLLTFEKSEQARQIDSARSSQASDWGILRWEHDINYGCVSKLGGALEKCDIF